MKRTCTAMLAGTLALAACATQEQTGAVTGGVLGGLAGSAIGGGSGRTAAIVGGTIIGALIGGAVGRSMDRQDHYQAQDALERGRSNVPHTWRNPDTGYTYAVTPTRTYESSAGQYCREYYTEATISGRRERVYGTACRQPDGSWQSVG